LAVNTNYVLNVKKVNSYIITQQCRGDIKMALTEQWKKLQNGIE